MNDCMIDIETLGKRPGCVVISIGAVLFDRNGVLGAEFYTPVNRDDCIRLELTEDLNTLAWWAEQSKEARVALEEARSTTVLLADALAELDTFLLDTYDVKVWGCGSDFDISILTECYARVDMQTPWKFWNSRCLRTLRDVAGPLHVSGSGGIAHNALDDARRQSKEVIDIFRKLNAK